LGFAGNVACINSTGFTTMDTSNESPIIATQVPEGQRLHFLPRHFGSQMMIFEHALYSQLSDLCADYQGGLWNFYDLSNGGCFLAPSEHKGYRISVEGNGFEGRLDAEGAGIVATLFTLSHLSMRYPAFERYAERFYQLREFALDYPDAKLIMAAID
jgi:hypothetical protein